jgi:lysophospholipase L1-like esterase
MRWLRGGLTRRTGPRQARFAFEERRERRDRWFKRAIALGTAVVIVGTIAGTRAGRYLVGRGEFEVRAAAERWIGLPPDRAAIDADWKLRRERDVEQTRRVYREVYAEASPEVRRVLGFGGMDPDSALLRWGNYHRILLLPGKVFLADEDGRSYRLRPNTRSIWLRNFDLPRGLSGFFLMPDEPELRQVIAGTGARIVPGSAQTTNSWGCRGPEPDLSAPVRGLILGDSGMQGLFVGDDETPAECLRRELQLRLGRRVSVLNTGHLGYSPEQIDHSLLEYGDRFRPNFVVFSFCSNDFGSLFDKVPDRRDVEEARYWLEEITQYCRQRQILQISTPVPLEYQVVAKRGEGTYPGRVCDLLTTSSVYYCNPVEAFVHEHLRLQAERRRRGQEHLMMSPLFNGAIGDAHFSALGAALWGKVVADRVALLLERDG